jgi:hypothetical protein
VSFNQSLSSLSLDFATSDFGTPSTITLAAYENGVFAGAVVATGTVPGGFTFPEGVLDFNQGPFNTVILSSAAPDFAIDNIAVNSISTTPEPASYVLLGTGLLLFGVFAMRRNPAFQFTKVAPVALFSLASLTGIASAQVTQSIFPLLPPVVSTVPSNGDVNPYGVVFAPKNTPKTGILQPGDILVSNFNNNQNLQGTGTTILRVDKAGNTSTFYTSSATGLTAAIGVLSDGIVLIGNLPTADGTSATVQPGRLAVLNNNGAFLGTFGTLATVNGPWGMAVYDTGNGVSGTAKVFVSNVLSGVVSRFDITYSASSISATDLVLADGFTHRLDPAAIVLGPSGLAYNASNDTLYVASSSDNFIYAIPTATAAHTSPVVPNLVVPDSTHLHGPLDIAILPDGNLVVANSDGSNVDPLQPSELVEYTPTGVFLNQMCLDPNNGGAFGVAVNNIGWGTFRMAAVDDNASTLNIWTAVAP